MGEVTDEEYDNAVIRCPDCGVVLEFVWVRHECPEPVSG